MMWTGYGSGLRGASVSNVTVPTSGRRPLIRFLLVWLLIWTNILSYFYLSFLAAAGIQVVGGVI